MKTILSNREIDSISSQLRNILKEQNTKFSAMLEKVGEMSG